MISEFSPLSIGFKTKNWKSRKIFFFFLIYKAQRNVGLFLHHYFNFLSVKTDTQKMSPVWLNRRVKRFSNPNTYYMTSNVAEWFWVWCHLNSISTVFEATFSYYSIMVFCRVSVISESLLLCIGLKTKIRKSWKISIFGSKKSNAYESIF